MRALGQAVLFVRVGTGRGDAVFVRVSLPWVTLAGAQARKIRLLLTELQTVNKEVAPD